MTALDGQLDLLSGLEDRERGMARALAAVPEWKDTAYSALSDLAAAGVPFTADDLLTHVGLPHDVGPNANNAVGAVFNKAARRKLIRATGRRVPSRRRSNHGRYLIEWVGRR